MIHLYNIYSVKLLFEHISSSNSLPSKTFEETINIVRAERMDDVDRLVKQHFKDFTYTNELGESTTIKLVMILDIFKLIDNIEESLDFGEVYSRHLVFDEDISFA